AATRRVFDADQIGRRQAAYRGPMEADSIRARIEHETAELRARYPEMTRCDTALARRVQDGATLHSLYLDMRWPQSQILLPGPALPDATAAIDAAFHEARRCRAATRRNARCRRADGAGGRPFGARLCFARNARCLAGRPRARLRRLVAASCRLARQAGRASAQGGPQVGALRD